MASTSPIATAAGTPLHLNALREVVVTLEFVHGEWKALSQRSTGVVRLDRVIDHFVDIVNAIN
jgi:hypothetical protein